MPGEGNLFSDLLSRLQNSLRENLLSSLTSGIKSLLPGIFGSQGQKKEGGKEDGLAGMFQALMGKIDNLISKLDSAVGVKDARAVNQSFYPGSTPSIGRASSSQADSSGRGYGQDYANRLDEILKGQNPWTMANQGGAPSVKNDPLTSLLNQALGMGGKAPSGVNVGKASGLGSKFLSAEGAGEAAGLGGLEAAGLGAAPETMGLSLAIPALIETGKLIADHVNAIEGHVKDMGMAGVRAFMSERTEDIGENIAGGARSGLKGYGRAIGGPLFGGLMEEKLDNSIPGMLLKFTETGFQAIRFLRDFSDNLTKTNLQFAQFSGSMAFVEANLEFQRVVLGMERGERRAGSALALSNAQMGTERALAPLEDQWANVKSEFMAGLHKVFQDILKGSGIADNVEGQLADLVGIVRSWFKKDQEDKDENEWTEEQFQQSNRQMREVDRFMRDFNRRRGR